MNKVILIGRLTKDPELNFVKGSGEAITKFSLAINRQFKKEEVDFINCVAFKKSALTIAEYFKKGSKIALVGSIRTSSYTSLEGIKKYNTEVILESFEFVESKAKEFEGSPFEE